MVDTKEHAQGRVAAPEQGSGLRRSVGRDARLGAVATSESCPDGGALFIEKHRADTRTVIALIKLYTGRRPLGGARATHPATGGAGATVCCLLTGAA